MNFLKSQYPLQVFQQVLNTFLHLTAHKPSTNGYSLVHNQTLLLLDLFSFWIFSSDPCVDLLPQNKSKCGRQQGPPGFVGGARGEGLWESGDKKCLRLHQA